MGPDPRVVVLILKSAYLHVKISVKVFRVFRVSVMHLWATLGCGVFSCHSNLVNHVRGSMSAPSVKSVAHRAVCAEISSSSDVKSYSNQSVIYLKPKSSNCLNTQRE